MKRWYTICSICVLVVLFGWGLGDFFSTNQYLKNQENASEEHSAAHEEANGSEQGDNPVYANQNPAASINSSFEQQRGEDNPEGETEEQYQYQYLMKLHNGTICVYYKDESSLWMDTQISEQDITSDAREKLTEGVYVKNIWDVYSYLESYTS